MLPRSKFSMCSKTTTSEAISLFSDAWRWCVESGMGGHRRQRPSPDQARCPSTSRGGGVPRGTSLRRHPHDQRRIQGCTIRSDQACATHLDRCSEPIYRAQDLVAILGELHPLRQLVRELPVAGRRRELAFALRFRDIRAEIVKVALVHRPESVAAAALRLKPQASAERKQIGVVCLERDVQGS